MSELSAKSGIYGQTTLIALWPSITLNLKCVVDCDKSYFSHTYRHENSSIFRLLNFTDHFISGSICTSLFVFESQKRSAENICRSPHQLLLWMWYYLAGKERYSRFKVMWLRSKKTAKTSLKNRMGTCCSRLAVWPPTSMLAVWWAKKLHQKWHRFSFNGSRPT